MPARSILLIISATSAGFLLATTSSSEATVRPLRTPTSLTLMRLTRTLSGKVLEVPVKRILMGDAPDKAASRESLANPEAFDWFVTYASQTLK